MSIRLKIGGDQFVIDERLKEKLKFFSKANLIERVDVDAPIEIKTIEKEAFIDMLTIYKEVDQELPEVPKVRTRNIYEVLGHKLGTILSKRNYVELNALYKTAYNLEFDEFRRCIIAALATKVYFSPVINDLEQCMKAIQIKQTPTGETIKEMKEKYSFLN